MKYFNKLLLAAAVAMVAATSAHADAPDLPNFATYVPADPGAPGVTNLTWSFTDIGLSGPHIANTAFDEVFIFNVPDAEKISFKVASVMNGADFVKNSTGYTLWGGAGILFGGSSTVLDAQAVTTPLAFNSGSYSLTSGTYMLEVSGTYTSYNGFYAGQITGIQSAVPEPTSVLMLLAGLAGLAGVARLRKSRV